MSGPRVAPGGEAPAPPASPPHRVRLPVNVHEWNHIAFLHWPFDPDDLAPLIPAETEVLTYEGTAWVGVTPFRITVRPPGLPFTGSAGPGSRLPLPARCRFPETNVRTYVAGRDGRGRNRQGLWFLRMEVTAAWFVAALRTLGLPYVRRTMSVDVGDDRIRYRSVGSPAGGDQSAGGDGRPAGGDGHDIVVRPDEPLEPPSGDAFARFLTARWGTFHRRGPALLYTPVEHPPWTLATAVVEHCDVAGLFRAAGLPAPAGAPVAHVSEGVAAKIGRPRFVSLNLAEGG